MRFRIGTNSSDFIQTKKKNYNRTYIHIIKSSYVIRFETYEFDSLFSISYDHVKVWLSFFLYMYKKREGKIRREGGASVNFFFSGIMHSRLLFSPSHSPLLQLFNRRTTLRTHIDIYSFIFFLFSSVA